MIGRPSHAFLTLVQAYIVDNCVITCNASIACLNKTIYVYDKLHMYDCVFLHVPSTFLYDHVLYYHACSRVFASMFSA